MGSAQPMLELERGFWTRIRDGNPTARAFFRRHYSHRPYADGRDPALFVGPGGKIVLMAARGDALFVWRKFVDDCIDERTGRPQEGVNCAAFRNESGWLSSDLILEAEAFAWDRWPGERLYTYVDTERVRSSNPGWCFLCAGWKRCGFSRSGKLVLEKLWLWRG